jgi:monoamine oxidase
MPQPSVCILGAGAAGLNAARILASGGIPVRILEARSRIGGRILTLREPGLPVPIELGAEFIHGLAQPTLALAREARLTPIDIPFEHMQRHGGRLAKNPGFEELLGQGMPTAEDLRGADISFAEFLRRKRAGKRWTAARRIARDFVQGFDAADPEIVSARSIAEEQEGVGEMDSSQFRLLGGYGALLEFLRRRVREHGAEILLNRVVSDIRWRRGGVEIRCAGNRQVVRATHAIVTLPVGVLLAPAGARGAVRFDPEIPATLRAAGMLASGAVIKVLLRFREAFWEDPAVARRARAGEALREASFLHGPGAPFPTWWTARPLRLPLLTGWVGGPRAAALSDAGRPAIQRAAIHSLCDLFRMRPPQVRGMLESFHTWDWQADPFSRGAYSYVRAGGMRGRALLARPAEKTLFFAGEAADTSGQASTVAGALASGERAAHALIDSL